MPADDIAYDIACNVARFRQLAAAILALGLAASADAQTCNTLTGGVNCGGSTLGETPSPRSSGSGSPEQYRTFSSPISDLGVAFGGDQASTFGAITFSGGNSRCSGLFRTTRC
jgi:hypothetical protein